MKTKGTCTWTAKKFFLPKADSAATTLIPCQAPSKHDKLSDDGEDEPENQSIPDIFAQLGPKFEEEEGTGTSATPYTPPTAVCKRDAV